MSFEYSVHPEENLVRLRWTGEFTIEALIGRMNEMASEGALKAGMNVLGDYREADWIGVVGEMTDYLDYSESVNEARGVFKSAVLIGTEEDMELVTMFDRISHQRGLGIETKGFLGEEEALAWLGNGG
jgi:hypothetical protein